MDLVGRRLQLVGREGQEQECAYDLLVGADGWASKVGC